MGANLEQTVRSERSTATVFDKITNVLLLPTLTGVRAPKDAFHPVDIVKTTLVLAVDRLGAVAKLLEGKEGTVLDDVVHNRLPEGQIVLDELLRRRISKPWNLGLNTNVGVRPTNHRRKQRRDHVGN
jgi:hypothetical protein